MVTSQVVSGAGVRLRVFEHGERSGPTVVLVHGYPDTSAVWNAVVADLQDDHHVVTYDVRGAGGSERPPGRARYAMQLLLADLRSVIDAVAPGERVHLVGHDWGAIQAFAAAQDASLADRLASVTAVSAPGLDVVAHRVRSMGLRDLPGGLRQLARSWYVLTFQLPVLPTAVWRGGLGRLWPRRTAALAGPGYPAPTLIGDATAGVELYRANRPGPGPVRFHTPVQVLSGARDPFVTPWVFDRVAELGDDVTVELVDGEHWLPRTHPELLAERVRATATRHHAATTVPRASA